MFRTCSVAVVLFVGASAASATTVNPYQEFASVDCTAAADCVILFPKVTEETLILHASCSFALPNGVPISFASLGSQNANPRNELHAFINSNSATVTTWGINAETYLFVAKDDRPRIDVFGVGAAVTGLVCTVSGNKLGSRPAE